MHVDVVGSGPRLVLVHGSGGNTGWPLQRRLADRYTLVMPTRGGYPPNPPLDGAGHSIPRTGEPFNGVLVDFLDSV